MKIEKRDSGNFRIRHTEKGKTYSVTLPFKPTQAQAWTIIQNKINNKPILPLTFDEACRKFFTAKSNVYSPATVRGYRSIYRNIDKSILPLNLEDIDNITMQETVNKYAKTHSPKSVSNYYGFLTSVIKTFNPEVKYSIKLPQKERKKRYFPTLEDIQKVIKESKDTVYFVPLYLACLGLRNSEICALTIDDLTGDDITISKALVRSEKKYVLKNTPKTSESYRTITLPHELAEKIREQGFIYEGYPQQPDKYLTRTLKKLGIPHFSIHSMRHFFVAYSHSLGFSDSVIQELGGWSPRSNTMQSVYRYALGTDEAKKKVADDFKF